MEICAHKKKRNKEYYMYQISTGVPIKRRKFHQKINKLLAKKSMVCVCLKDS